MTELEKAARMALEALEQAHDESLDDNHFECRQILMGQITALRRALEQPAQEPLAWMPIEQMYPQAKAIDILMGDGSILCAVLPQFDGDLWWEGSGTGEKFIDPKYANVTHWRIHGETRPQAREQPAQQEPVAWPCEIAEADFEQNTITLEMQCSDYIVGAGQHWLTTTRPQAREPLTDEEICRIGAQVHGFLLCNEGQWGIEMARAIEAAHGIAPDKSDCHSPDWTERDGEYLK